MPAVARDTADMAGRTDRWRRRLPRARSRRRRARASPVEPELLSSDGDRVLLGRAARRTHRLVVALAYHVDPGRERPEAAVLGQPTQANPEHVGHAAEAARLHAVPEVPRVRRRPRD